MKSPIIDSGGTWDLGTPVDFGDARDITVSDLQVGSAKVAIAFWCFYDLQTAKDTVARRSAATAPSAFAVGNEAYDSHGEYDLLTFRRDNVVLWIDARSNSGANVREIAKTIDDALIARSSGVVISSTPLYLHIWTFYLRDEYRFRRQQLRGLFQEFGISDPPV